MKALHCAFTSWFYVRQVARRKIESGRLIIFIMPRLFPNTLCFLPFTLILVHKLKRFLGYCLKPCKINNGYVAHKRYSQLITILKGKISLKSRWVYQKSLKFALQRVICLICNTFATVPFLKKETQRCIQIIDADYEVRSKYQVSLTCL